MLKQVIYRPLYPDPLSAPPAPWSSARPVTCALSAAAAFALGVVA